MIREAGEMTLLLSHVGQRACRRASARNPLVFAPAVGTRLCFHGRRPCVCSHESSRRGHPRGVQVRYRTLR